MLHCWDETEFWKTKQHDPMQGSEERIEAVLSVKKCFSPLQTSLFTLELGK